MAAADFPSFTADLFAPAFGAPVARPICRCLSTPCACALEQQAASESGLAEAGSNLARLLTLYTQQREWGESSGAVTWSAKPVSRSGSLSTGVAWSRCCWRGCC